MDFQQRTDNIFKRADALSINSAKLAALSESVSTSTLSRVRNGLQAFAHKELVVLEDLLVDLEEIARRAAPAPISWKNIAAVKSLLGNLREERRSPAEPASFQSWSDLMCVVAFNESLDDLVSRTGLAATEIVAQLEPTVRRVNRRFAELKRSVDKT
jgi:hypothetical protein